MIDLHTHTLLSDGELLPSELVRRAWAKGYEAIALTDHVDSSNIDHVLPRLVRVSKVLNKYWPIKVLPGVEITHAPLKEIAALVGYSRENGALIVVVHGETVTEPVLPGTNAEAIRSCPDILSHPGRISDEDAGLAAKLGVALEITARAGHSVTNRHVKDAAASSGARLVFNTDAHCPGDLVDIKQAEGILGSLGLSTADIDRVFRNSLEIIGKTI